MMKLKSVKLKQMRLVGALIAMFLAILLVSTPHAFGGGGEGGGEGGGDGGWEGGGERGGERGGEGGGEPEGGGDGRGRPTDPRPGILVEPDEIVAPSERDCPVALEASICKYVKNGCIMQNRFCNVHQDFCLVDEYKAQCKTEELARAITRFNENLPKVLDALKLVVSLANAAQPLVVAFTSSGGCEGEYNMVRPSLDALGNAYAILQTLEISMATDFSLVVDSGAVDKLTLSTVDGNYKLHVVVEGRNGTIILDASPALFSGPSWKPISLSAKFVGVQLDWNTSAIKIGKATLTTVTDEGHWREEPRFNDTAGSPYERKIELPPGTRYCDSSFHLAETSFVCGASVQPSLDGLRIFAFIRGDDNPGSRRKGEFGFKATLVGIDESATSCQAKQAKCVAPVPRFDPTAGGLNVVSCSNVRNPNLSDACEAPIACIQGTRICSGGRFESGVCINRGRGTYICGNCQSWDTDF